MAVLFPCVSGVFGLICNRFRTRAARFFRAYNVIIGKLESVITGCTNDVEKALEFLNEE